jgi:predicted ATPase
MPALLELHVENFKSLKTATVPLGPLNVLVGPNASGKSNLLDVIQFLGDSVRTDLRPALDKRGGFHRVRFRDGVSSPIKIEIEANVTKYSHLNARDVYTLSISLAGRLKPKAASDDAGRRLLISRRESFKSKRTQGRGRRITISGRRVQIFDETPKGEETREIGLGSESLGLATLPKLAEDEGGEAINQIASLFSTFRVFDIAVDAARRPSETAESKTLAPDAANLASFLNLLRKEQSETFAQLVADAREFVPGLIDLHFEPIGGSRAAVALQLEERGLVGRTDLADASYGTIRALALLALLYDPNPPALTCVEEIDHGLHPYVFDLLVDRLREASDRTQFLIATHSPALVNRLDPKELIVCERDDDGASRIPAVDAQTIAALKAATEGELRLGEIWFSGSLGGVPA